MTAYLAPLPWDSAHLGLPCARLDWSPPLPISPVALATEIAAALSAAAPAALVAAKLPAGRCEPRALQAALPKWRVKMLGVEVVHHRPAGVSDVVGGSDVTFYPGTADPAPFLPLAWDMRYSRYHLDPKIDTARAVSLWEASITDHCRGFAQEVAVIAQAGRPAGMATLHLDVASARLHIVGVLAWARGQGLGRRLLETIIVRHGHTRDLLVEAHADNRAAAALYATAGFRPASRCDVLHFWNTTN